MRSYTKFKLVILLLFFLGLNSIVIAKETLRFTIQGHPTSFVLKATAEKQFTVDWGNGFIDTYLGTGIEQYVNNSHPFNPNITFYNIIITSSCTECKFSSISISRITSFDASGAPSLIKIDLSNFTDDHIILTYCNLSNCSLLEKLYISTCSLKDIDLSDCTSLREIYVLHNKLSVLDLSSTPVEVCGTPNNCLPLSQCYPISLQLPDPLYGSYGYQTLPTQRIWVGESVDYSSEKEFGGIATLFAVTKGSVPAHQNDYSIEDGIITFHSRGQYTVRMRNAAIIEFPINPPLVVDVVVYVSQPVTDIIKVPATATVNIPLALTGTVIPNDATYQSIIWSVKDTSTTGATITGNRLNTKAEGMVIVTATIKNATPSGDYKQDFSIEVIPLGINEPAQELSNITIYPNPTNGELEFECENLIINKIDILDIKGSVVLSQPFNILSAQYRIDISNFGNGIYFLKITTERGEIVKKIVKQE
jgi:hypothetical protein